MESLVTSPSKGKLFGLPVPLLERRVVLIATALCFATVFTGTHLPPSQPTTGSGTLGDKNLHLVAYLGIGFTLTYCLHCVFAWPSLSLTCLAFLLGALFGAFDELSQPYFDRCCDLNDWFADLSGLGFGISLFLFARSHLPELCQARGLHR
jgi:VanZ family protein